MLGLLSAALLAGSQPTNEVAVSITSLARTYGRPDMRIVALPTLVIIDDPAADAHHTAVFEVSPKALRLDQVASLESLITHAARDRTDPDAVIDQTQQIVAAPPRFGFWTALLGHVLLAEGFGLIISPVPSSLPIYAALGLVVGVLVLTGSRVRTLALVLPVAAAFIATALVGILAPSLASESMLSFVTPALVSLLPGLTLTNAAVELTNGQIIAGASRLLYGTATLALLAFGLYLGIVLTGVSHPHTSTGTPLGVWASWLGIPLVAIGYYFFSVAPKRSFLWILLALTVAYSAQLLGHALLGAALSGLIGAMIAVPVIYLVTHLPTAPPPGVMLTCAYWMMVPGSMGFVGLTEVVSGNAGSSNLLLQTAGAIVAIAIGMIIGTGVSRDTGAFTRALRRAAHEQP
ncbi:threonine/serine exporter family protein [Microbacterium sp. H1-D42]|uniref:threonine/serine ThrE exporter family protein n=1 Tax=Microbacterium sp. H1-D42 TaxID=2925844 RepID=UPI001F534C33|nr:threonine/serine exporter family protein [Microbacterium sp. H1-D42]UNK71315.1 threonine/serine exporter family protein [Microbacterium sp. H1-D42]